jgi:hypothetical protein
MVTKCHTTHFQGFDQSNLCSPGTGCEGFSLSGLYKLCEKEGGADLVVDLRATVPEGFDYGDSKGIALSWGVAGFPDDD